MHFGFKYLGSFYYYPARQGEEGLVIESRDKFESLSPHRGANLSIRDRMLSRSLDPRTFAFS